jgi:GT2 family glycosyltransferase
MGEELEHKLNQIGLVAIGRNEGDRLRQCLVSVMGKVNPVVYVDSGSTDDSLEMARSLGAEVVELDLSIPFTAARARNAGFERLLKVAPETKYVQFLDGDCEVVPGWLEKAAQELDARPELGVVGGRCRERFPERSIYNKMCDIEWDTPIGESKYCGGNNMMRVEAFQQVEGFNLTLIAGEEPELCVRLRQKGWKIFRMDAEMTLHDAQITRFGQWWKRTMRSGHAFAEGAWLHGKPPERHWVKHSRSIWFWGLILPLLSLGMSWPSHGFSLLLLAAYPISTYRTYHYYMQAQELASKDAALYALFCTLGKFPQVQGQIQFHLNRLLGRRQNLIEYKTSSPVEEAK